jgi:hypothetical protein
VLNIQFTAAIPVRRVTHDQYSPVKNPILRFASGGERFHFLHLVGEAVNILNEDLDYGRRPIMPAFRLFHTGAMSLFDAIRSCMARE